MKVAIFHANAGFGHRKIAEIIHQEFKDRGLSNSDMICEDALDSTPAIFKNTYPAVYYYSVKFAPNSWGASYELMDTPFWGGLVHPVRTTANRFFAGALLKRIEKEKPDVMIFTHFLTAELFSRAKREGRIQSKLITVITDFYPHSYWVNPGTDLYWVMSDEGKKDLESRGVPSEKIIAGGIPVGKDFLPKGRKKETLQKWNFSTERFTILLTSGSFGLGPTGEILRELEAFKDRIQVFVVCGNNKETENELKAKSFPFPCQVFGFVNFMPDLMEASDLMVAKSGGSTTCESLTKGLPMVVLKPIPGQETRNANLLKSRNASFFMDRPDEIKPILTAIFDHPQVMLEKRKAITALAKPHAARDVVTEALRSIQ